MIFPRAIAATGFFVALLAYAASTSSSAPLPPLPRQLQESQRMSQEATSAEEQGVVSPIVADQVIDDGGTASEQVAYSNLVANGSPTVTPAAGGQTWSPGQTGGTPVYSGGATLRRLLRHRRRLSEDLTDQDLTADIVQGIIPEAVGDALIDGSPSAEVMLDDNPADLTPLGEESSVPEVPEWSPGIGYVDETSADGSA